MSNELTVNDLPWANQPALMAGIAFYVEKVSLPRRAYWKARGLTRQRYEVGLRTSRGNRFSFIGGSRAHDIEAYMDVVVAMDAEALVAHMNDVDSEDEEFGYTHRITDALMAQWHEICFAWNKVIPGDFVILEDDQDVETVDGEGVLPVGTSFMVYDVLFDEERSVLSRSTTGDVVATPWSNFTVLAERPDGSGRESGECYLYSRDRGYVYIGKDTE